MGEGEGGHVRAASPPSTCSCWAREGLLSKLKLMFRFWGSSAPGLGTGSILMGRLPCLAAVPRRRNARRALPLPLPDWERLGRGAMPRSLLVRWCSLPSWLVAVSSESSVSVSLSDLHQSERDGGAGTHFRRLCHHGSGRSPPDGFCAPSPLSLPPSALSPLRHCPGPAEGEGAMPRDTPRQVLPLFCRCWRLPQVPSPPTLLGLAHACQSELGAKAPDAVGHGGSGSGCLTGGARHPPSLLPNLSPSFPFLLLRAGKRRPAERGRACRAIPRSELAPPWRAAAGLKWRLSGGLSFSPERASCRTSLDPRNFGTPGRASAERGSPRHPLPLFLSTGVCVRVGGGGGRGRACPRGSPPL